ncbi:major facilitator superfamily domain-containing protein [Dipodascopsis tothii]|uniref:major facilitator superfamily domain-containing protein n=1 Tax=Dipodascopsis tothii TaxID=44089 RepID=UPI0034CE6509
MPHHLDVPLGKRLIQVACAVTWCLLAAGPIFGFAALKTVWLREGVYADYCTPDENFDGIVCSRREIKINFIFTCASVVTNFAGVIVGVILDKYGPRTCNFIGSALLFLGSILLAFATTTALLDTYVCGYMALAFAGPFIFISSFQLANAFPVHSGLILALLTGAFDSSTAVYLVYRLIYDETNGRFHPKEFFLLYLAVPVFILVANVTVMPKESYKPGTNIMDVISGKDTTRSEEVINDSDLEEIMTSTNDIVATDTTPLLSGTDVEMSAEEVKEYNSEELKLLKTSGVWGILHGTSVLKQIRTPWFILLCLFTLIQMVRLNYFVASIRAQYSFLFHDERIAETINSFFDIALPVGGIVSIPLSGYLLDHYSMATALSVLLAMGTAFGILGNFAAFPAAYANIVIFVLYRSMFYTTVSDYTGKVFGYDTFGKVYGLISTISGLFNFAQSGFDHVTHQVFSRDPRPVNVTLVTLSASIGTLFVYYVSKQAKRIRRSALEIEAEQAPVIRMPGYTNDN